MSLDELYPPLASRGKTHQMTSWDAGPMRLPGRYGEWSRKCVLLRPNEPHTIAKVQGSGLITRFFVAFPLFWHRGHAREVVLRMFWDGAEEPAVQVPIGDFFGLHFCRYRQYSSRLFSLISGGMVCEAPMPF